MRPIAFREHMKTLPPQIYERGYRPGQDIRHAMIHALSTGERGYASAIRSVAERPSSDPAVIMGIGLFTLDLAVAAVAATKTKDPSSVFVILGNKESSQVIFENDILYPLIKKSGTAAEFRLRLSQIAEQTNNDPKSEIRFRYLKRIMAAANTRTPGFRQHKREWRLRVNGTVWPAWMFVEENYQIVRDLFNRDNVASISFCVFDQARRGQIRRKLLEYGRSLNTSADLLATAFYATNILQHVTTDSDGIVKDFSGKPLGIPQGQILRAFCDNVFSLCRPDPLVFVATPANKSGGKKRSRFFQKEWILPYPSAEKFMRDYRRPPYNSSRAASSVRLMS